MNELLLIVLAYLIGSIPSSVWVGRYFFDIDIREYGSGNAGATNTYRVLGPTWGTIVMVADMLKGILAVKLGLLLPAYFESETQLQTLQIGLGLAAVLGCACPCFRLQHDARLQEDRVQVGRQEGPAAGNSARSDGAGARWSLRDAR